MTALMPRSEYLKAQEAGNKLRLASASAELQKKIRNLNPCKE